jgi:hypothetical protein
VVLTVTKHQILGWVVGVSLFLLLLQLMPEVRCADGWASRSIGRPGACSHHGGVRGNGMYVMLIFGLSITAGLVTARILKPKVAKGGRRMGGWWQFWRRDEQKVQWRQRRREATSAARWVKVIAKRIVKGKRPLERDMESLHCEMTHLTAAFARWLEADRKLDRP